MTHIPVTLRLVGVAAVSIGLYACFGTDSGSPDGDDPSKLGSVSQPADCGSDVLLQVWYNDTCTCNSASGSTTCGKRYTTGKQGTNPPIPNGEWILCGWDGSQSSLQRCQDNGALTCRPSCGASTTALTVGIPCTSATLDAAEECWGFYETISSVKGRCGWSDGSCHRLGTCGP